MTFSSPKHFLAMAFAAIGTCASIAVGQTLEAPISRDFSIDLIVKFNVNRVCDAENVEQAQITSAECKRRVEAHRKSCISEIGVGIPESIADKEMVDRLGFRGAWCFKSAVYDKKYTNEGAEVIFQQSKRERD